MKIRYKTGNRIKNDRRNLFITGQKLRTTIRKDGQTERLVFDQCYCLNCKQALWIRDSIVGKEGDRAYKCSVCSGKTVVPGINDFATIRPDLVQYFVCPENAQLFTVNSNKEDSFKCPYCGYIKRTTYGRLNQLGFGCPFCDDASTYPERFVLSLLRQFNIDCVYQAARKTLKWCRSYKYDFYLQDKRCIIETHGIQHYEECSFTKRTLAEEQENDKQKEELAKLNGIDNYIIINCSQSNLKWMKDNIINSGLLKLLNINEQDVDWNECNLKSYQRNGLENVCNLWNEYKSQNIYISVTIIADKLNKNEDYIRNCLKRGAELGLCNYDAQQAFHDSKIQPRIKDEVLRELANYWDDHCQEVLSTVDIGKVFGLRRYTVCNYLKIATEKGYCNYNPKEALKQSVSKNGKACGKIVRAYTSNHEFIGECESAYDMTIFMKNTYNESFNRNGITRVCRKERPHYKTFVFRFSDDDELYDKTTQTN